MTAYLRWFFLIYGLAVSLDLGMANSFKGFLFDSVTVLGVSNTI